MTAYPSRTHHQDSHDAAQPGMIRAVGAVGLMLGTLGVALSPFTVMRLVGSSNDTNFALHNPTWWWMAISSIASSALSVLLLIAATGCLKLRRWGRWTMILYSIGSLILGIGGGYFYLRWMGVPGGIPRGQGGVVTWIQLTGWLFGVPYALWALYAVTRSHAREAFTQVPPSRVG